MIRKTIEQMRSTCVLRFVHYAEVQPWSLLDYTCGKILWNLDDIQRSVVLKFAIFGPSIRLIQRPSFKVKVTRTQYKKYKI